MSETDFKTSREIIETDSFEELRSMFLERGVDEEISDMRKTGAKLTGIVHNTYRKLKSIMKREDFQYIDEIEFITDTYIFEKARYEHHIYESIKNQNEIEAQEEVTEGEGSLPGYDIEKGDVEINLRAYLDHEAFEIPDSYRTELNSRIIEYREKGLTVVTQKIANSMSIYHLSISRNNNNFKDIKDHSVHYGMAKGGSSVFNSSWLYKPLIEDFIDYNRTKSTKGEKHIQKDWKTILKAEDSFTLPKEIDKGFLEKWYPEKARLRHDRIVDILDTVDLLYKEETEERNIDNLYLISTFNEIPLIKQYIEEENCFEYIGED